MAVEFSPGQQQAIDAVADWYNNSDEQIFRLFGYAGTGKTFLAKTFAENLPAGHRCGVAAVTGKAAYVLNQKGCPASTIHRLIYRLVERSSPPKFELNPDSPLRSLKLLILDEVSMVGDKLGKDLESFGTKMLVLGDPAQLPPVGDAGRYINAEPNIMLKEIHRQAEGNPIISMATKVRHRKPLSIGEYGESTVEYQMRPDACIQADQLLVGKNKTRRLYNQAFRRHYNRGDSRGEGYPQPKDKIVCLRNNHQMGLFNGSIWIVRKVRKLNEDRLLDLISEDEKDTLKGVWACGSTFLDGKIPEYQKRDQNFFDYGYALTCHKSQGSQWDNVAIIDESAVFGEDRYKWLYTAITRAAERVTVFMRG